MYACERGGEAAGSERLGDELGGSRIGAKALTFIICPLSWAVEDEEGGP